jgi:hypothetical protein
MSIKSKGFASFNFRIGFFILLMISLIALARILEFCCAERYVCPDYTWLWFVGHELPCSAGAAFNPRGLLATDILRCHAIFLVHSEPAFMDRLCSLHLPQLS